MYDRHNLKEDLGCLIGAGLVLVVLGMVTFGVISVRRDNSLVSSALCPGDTKVEIRLIETGANWIKHLVKTDQYSVTNSTLILIAHDEQISDFTDILSVESCSEKGIVVKGVLKGTSDVKTYLIDKDKNITIYHE